MDETAAPKRAVNLELDSELVGKAEEFGLSIAELAERAVARHVEKQSPGLTKAEITAAVRFWNDYDARHLAVADDAGAV